MELKKSLSAIALACFCFVGTAQAAYMEGGSVVKNRQGFEQTVEEVAAEETATAPAYASAEVPENEVPAEVSEDEIYVPASAPTPVSAPRASSLNEWRDYDFYELDEDRIPVGERRNSLGFFVFYGASLDTGDVDTSDLFGGGFAFEYRYTFYDGRCDKCGHGNRLNLAMRLGGSAYESGTDEHTSYYGYDYSGDMWYHGREDYTVETSSFFGSFGLNWEHQLTKSISTVLGGFVGVEYLSVDIDGTAGYYSWSSYSYSYSSYSVSDDDFGTFFGGTIGFNFVIADRHSIEIGFDVLYSTTELDDIGYGKHLTCNGRIGYNYRF